MIRHVDLASGRSWAEEIPPSSRRTVIGGSGLNSSLLYKLASPGVKPLDSANPLILGIGPGWKSPACWMSIIRSGACPVMGCPLRSACNPWALTKLPGN